MKSIYFNLACCLFCFVYSIAAHSQLNGNDSVFYNSSIDTLREFYKKEMKEDLRLYTGSQYLQFGGRVKGYVFFESPDFLKGDIQYDNKLYTDVKMRYDLEKDEIIVDSYSENYPIKLIAERVGYFNLDNHLFMRFVPDSSTGNATRPGFFDKIYSAENISAFVKREKKLEMPVNTEDNVPEYKQYDSYYILLNGKSYKVENTSSVPGILNDKKSPVRKFIRSSHFARKKITDKMLKEILTYYTNLK
jgi:hypothetical protein